MKKWNLTAVLAAILGSQAMPEPEAKAKKWKTTDISYLTQAPVGVVGDITRPDESNTEPAMLVDVSDVFAAGFGIPMKYTTGGIQQFNGGGETKAAFAGVLVREAPGISGSSADDTSLGGGTPLPTQVQGLLVRGYCSVKCWVGTPARGGVVYIQIVTSGGVPVGGFRSDGTDSGNAIALDAVQAEWASDGVDTDKTAELRVAR